MKKNKSIRFTALFLLAIIHIGTIQATIVSDSSERIIIDKNSKTLTAPDAVSYSWYLNGVKLPAAGNQFTVDSSGRYTVVYTKANGEIIEKSVSLQVSSAGKVIVIYTIGDSTVQDYTSGYYPRTGWGQVLQYFFNKSNVLVDNRAVGGTSSKSFYNNYWKINGKSSQIVQELDSGNYVFIQFGINDSNPDTARYTDAYGTFKEYLTKYVTESRAKGAIPVLVATLRRSSWNSDGTPYDAYHGYPIATRQLAAELNVPLIDLDKRSGVLMTQLGRDYISPYWYMILDPGEYANYPTGNSDAVHFQRAGAIEMARLVVDELQKNSSYPLIDSLLRYTVPNYQVAVVSNDPKGGLVTRTASYPQGLEVTLKAKPNPGYVFAGWKNESGTTVSTNLVYTFTMGTAAASYTASFRFVGLGGTEAWLEAECGSAGTLWNVADDALASNGKYLAIQPGNNSTSSAPGTAGQITYTFNVEAGIYDMYWRVLLPTTSDDSFWMKLDNGAWSQVSWGAAVTSWLWKKVGSYELTAGNHILAVAYREDGAKLDKIYWGSNVPTDTGGDANNCGTLGLNANYTDSRFMLNTFIGTDKLLHIQYMPDTPVNAAFEIYDSQGVPVYCTNMGTTGGNLDYQLSLRSLPFGLYVIRADFGGKVIAGKFIVH
ncbi:MAG: GDSL-type esterase/lipase family protein [Paludibacter sp.]